MTIKVASTRQTQADNYKNLGRWLGLATGNPGDTSTPANELSGNGPEGAYARVQVAATSGTGGLINYANGSINAPATGSEYTVTHVIICSAATGNTMFDWAPLTTPQKVGPLGGVITLTGMKFTQT